MLALMRRNGRLTQIAVCLKNLAVLLLFVPAQAIDLGLINCLFEWSGFWFLRLWFLSSVFTLFFHRFIHRWLVSFERCILVLDWGSIVSFRHFGIGGIIPYSPTCLYFEFYLFLHCIQITRVSLFHCWVWCYAIGSLIKDGCRCAWLPTIISRLMFWLVELFITTGD